MVMQSHSERTNVPGSQGWVFQGKAQVNGAHTHWGKSEDISKQREREEDMLAEGVTTQTRSKGKPIGG